MGPKRISAEEDDVAGFEDNNKAVSLYERVGFQRISRIPLRKIIDNDEVMWEEDEKLIGSYSRASLVMAYRYV